MSDVMVKYRVKVTFEPLPLTQGEYKCPNYWGFDTDESDLGVVTHTANISIWSLPENMTLFYVNCLRVWVRNIWLAQSCTIPDSIRHGLVSAVIEHILNFCNDFENLARDDTRFL